MNPIVTVCVLTYNPDWIKFRNTLRSIICQKNVEFDIVISDDGSQENYFDKAEMYLKEYGFTAYRFIANKQNQGTVKNTISALRNVGSKYVKLISPGDFLYDENVLAKFVKFAKKNPAVAYFGNAVWYSVNNNEIKIYEDLQQPWDLTPWIENDYKKIRRNYLCRFDYILGAAFFCDRAVFWDYINQLGDLAKYIEDFCYFWQIVDNKKILYVNDFLVFYEYGFDISTCSSEKWNDLIGKDKTNCMLELYKYGKISYLEFKLNVTRNYLFILLLKVLIDPFSIKNLFFIPKDRVIINEQENVQKLRCYNFVE